jgi:GNAT superfamily N-acetyltransferase
MGLVFEPNTHVRIRPAHAGDVQAIAQVHVQAWHQTYRTIFPPAMLTAFGMDQRLAMWRDILQNRLNQQAVFVADLSGQVQGFAAFGAFRVDSSQGDLGDAAGVGEVYSIYLLQAAQGHGTGRQLMAQGAGWLRERGFAHMRAWVIVGNPAQAFYRHLGFRHIVTSHFDAGGKMLDEHCMECRL